MSFQSQALSERSSSDLSNDTLLEKTEYDLPYTPRKKTWWQRARMSILHAAFILSYTVICLTVVQKANRELNEISSTLVESPARSAVKNVKTVFHMGGNAIDTYFGSPPTEEIDQRWMDLQSLGTVRFSPEEMRRWGRIEEGVRLADGSGYMGTLNVFHELHCLRRVYMYIHKDHYYGSLNLSSYQEHMNLRHTMHCLEAIRRGVECRGDISPVTYRFKPDWKIPVANWSSPHECKDWNALNSWAKENSFDPYTPGLVIHPTLGPSYEGDFEMARKLGIELDKSHEHEHEH